MHGNIEGSFKKSRKPCSECLLLCYKNAYIVPVLSKHELNAHNAYYFFSSALYLRHWRFFVPKPFYNGIICWVANVELNSDDGERSETDYSRSIGKPWHWKVHRTHSGYRKINRRIEKNCRMIHINADILSIFGVFHVEKTYTHALKAKWPTKDQQQ